MFDNGAADATVAADAAVPAAIRSRLPRCQRLFAAHQMLFAGFDARLIFACHPPSNRLIARHYA